MGPLNVLYINIDVATGNFTGIDQSVTSRLETSRYRDFSQFFESIGLGLKIFGLKKKSWYWSRKYLVSKKSLSLGLGNFGLEKKSRYRS